VPRFGSSHFRLTADTLPAPHLNDYIEAQVHGGVLLAAHPEALVLDGGYLGTPSRPPPACCPAPSSGTPATG
jgi:hypothetical protein